MSSHSKSHLCVTVLPNTESSSLLFLHYIIINLQDNLSFLWLDLPGTKSLLFNNAKKFKLKRTQTIFFDFVYGEFI